MDDLLICIIKAHSKFNLLKNNVNFQFNWIFIELIPINFQFIYE